MKISITIIIMMLFCINVNSQIVQNFELKNKSSFSVNVYSLNAKYLFDYKRTLNPTLKKIERQNGSFVEIDLDFKPNSENKSAYFIGSRLLNGLLFEFYWCHQEKDKDGNEFSIYMLRRETSSLKIVGDPIEVYQFGKKELEGDAINKFNQATDQNQRRVYANIIESENSYVVIISDVENEVIKYVYYDKKLEKQNDFEHKYDLSGRIAINALDEKYDLPYVVRYFKAESKENLVNLVVDWYDLETDSFKETYLKIDKDILIYLVHYDISIDLDKREIEVSISTKNTDESSDQFQGVCISSSLFNLSTGDLINEQEIYIRNEHVVDEAFNKLLANSKISFKENPESLFTHIKNGLNVRSLDNGSKLVYSEEIINKYQMDGHLEDKIGSSGYLAKFDAEGGLIWSRFCPMDGYKNMYLKNHIFLMEKCIVFYGYDHKGAINSTGFNTVGKSINAAEGTVYLISYEDGALLSKSKVYDTKEDQGLINPLKTMQISENAIVIQVGNTTKLVDFSTINK